MSLDALLQILQKTLVLENLDLGMEDGRKFWPEALAQTIDWYKANEDWWRPLKPHAFNATMLSDSDRQRLSQPT